MPYNGSGTYAAPALPGSFNPATVGGSATDTAWNTLLADLSTALSTTITKDGQTTVTADIPMATHKITGMGAATADTGAVNRGQMWYVYGTQDPTGLTVVDFINIPSAVANLMLVIETIPTTDATNIALQTYGADGVLDTGVSDYSVNYMFAASGTATPGTTSATTSSAALNVQAGIDNGTEGYAGTVNFSNIQAASSTKGTINCTFFESTGAVIYTQTGAIYRREADRITGIRVLVTTGTTFASGKMTLYASNATA